MLLTIKGLGAQYIFKTCLRDGTPSRSDLEFINKQRVRPYLRKKKEQQVLKEKKVLFHFQGIRSGGLGVVASYMVSGPRKALLLD